MRRVSVCFHAHKDERRKYINITTVSSAYFLPFVDVFRGKEKRMIFRDQTNDRSFEVSCKLILEVRVYFVVCVFA